MQAFAGYFRVNTGRVQFLQMPAFSRSFVQQLPDFVQQLPDFVQQMTVLRAIATYSRWLSCWQL